MIGKYTYPSISPTLSNFFTQSIKGLLLSACILPIPMKASASWIGGWGLNMLTKYDSPPHQYRMPSLIVGETKDETLSILGEESLCAAHVFIGAAESIKGDVTIQGKGKLSSRSLILGSAQASQGTLTISDQGSVSIESTVNLGQEKDSQGSLVLKTSGLLNAAEILVGHGGTGILRIEDGGAVKASSLVNIPRSGRGLAVITSAQSLLTTPMLLLGYDTSSQGNLEIHNGAGLKVGQTLYIGYYGQGKLTAQGEGSSSTTRRLVLGQYKGSQGILNVLDGAAVTATDTISIGFHLGRGEATVTGLNAALAAALIRIGGHTMYPSFLTVSEEGSAASTEPISVGHYDGSPAMINIGAASGQAPTRPGILKGSLVLGAQGKVVFNHTADDYVFNNLIAGYGGVDVRSGRTIFSTPHTYQGNTTIYGGTLDVAGKLGPSFVVVKKDGMLSGSGMIDGLSSNGKTLPGSETAIGTLHIREELIMDDTHVYMCKTQSNGLSDLISVYGPATLKGVLRVQPLTEDHLEGVPYVYRILSAAQGITGRFSRVEELSPAYQLGLRYTAQEVWLTLLKGQEGSNSALSQGL